MKKLLVLLLLSSGVWAQKIEWPRGLITETRLKQYGDSLARQIRSESGTVPVTPILPDCPRKPVIYDISATFEEVKWNFGAEGFDSVMIEIFRLVGNDKIRFKVETIKPGSDHLSTRYPEQVQGNYSLKMTGLSCYGVAEKSFVIPPKVTGEIPNQPTQPQPELKPLDQIGAERVKIGGRTFTYNLSGLFKLKFNADGTITDATDDLITLMTIPRYRQYYAWYMEGYKVITKKDGSYQRIENLKLPDGIFTIRQILAENGVADNIDVFKQRATSNGLNTSNAKLSEIFLSIKSDTPEPGVAKSITPSWLEVTRRYNFPAVAVPKDLAPYRRVFATVWRNKDDPEEKYWALGANTNGYKEHGFFTRIMPRPGNMNEQDLYDDGRDLMQQFPFKSFILTDEYPENESNINLYPGIPNTYGKRGRLVDGKMIYEKWPISEKMAHFYQGAFDVLAKKYPGIDVKDTGLYGSYGEDDIQGYLFKKDKNTWLQALNEGVHYRYDIDGRMTNDLNNFYKSGAIMYRNMNMRYYMENNEYFIPYELIAANERMKIGTKTWKDADHERNLAVFSWQKVQPLGVNAQGAWNGLEFNSTGEQINFANGILANSVNLEIPAVWSEYITLGFWSSLVNSGGVLWNGGNAFFGSNTNRYHWWANDGQTQNQTWKNNAPGSAWEMYIAGTKGAPENEGDGLTGRLYASSGDAFYAGMEAWWFIRDRTTVLEEASYTSSEGSFTVTPGTTGYHLNGFGVLNRNQLNLWERWNQKKGISLIGSGKEGKVAIYYNGFLSPNLYEDNVTIAGHNFGRCYGRQTYVVKF